MIYVARAQRQRPYVFYQPVWLKSQMIPSPRPTLRTYIHVLTVETPNPSPRLRCLVSCSLPTDAILVFGREPPQYHKHGPSSGRNKLHRNSGTPTRGHKRSIPGESKRLLNQRKLQPGNTIRPFPEEEYLPKMEIPKQVM